MCRGGYPPKDLSSVSHHPPSTSAAMFGVSMDTGGLIEKLNGFVSPSSVIISGDLCHKHGVAYLQALQKATGWAVKSKQTNIIFNKSFKFLDAFNQNISLHIKLSFRTTDAH
jgi:hypothetical protein